MSKDYDAIIIGGGFFGLSVAEYLRVKLHQKRVLVLEKEGGLMQRASYNNQARVHNGYHYPRSLLTALRSRVNFPIFVRDFEQAIVDDFDKYYAVAHTFSKVSARQMELFAERIGADIKEAPTRIKSLFNDRLVENVYAVKECAFNATVLRNLLLNRISIVGVDIQTDHEALKVEAQPSGKIAVYTKRDKKLQAERVFNCTYSMINSLHKTSKLPLINLKHELAEIALMKPPSDLENISVTVMCGPFFSFMPFPDKQAFSLSHVRYTPHSEWHDRTTKAYKAGHYYLDKVQKISHFPQMIADAVRYLPGLRGSTYIDSLWEVKTVLPQSEVDDSRPILFKPHYGIQNYTCIMGGKIDNIYDTFRELDLLYGKA